MADIAELGLFIDSSGVVRATKELKKLHGQTGDNERSTTKLSKSYGGLKTAIAAVGVVALTKKLLDQVNTYTEIENKLRLVTTGTENLSAVQEELFRIAQDSRVSLEATSDLYFRLAKSTDDLGISQSRLAGVTETINKAVAISGTNAQAASAALFQMGQGLAANALRGQELNSVLEQIPRVAQAIADGMDVPLGKLRELAAEGKITSDVVIAAFESQAATISEEFETTDKTVSQAMQQIRNTALKTFGEIDSDELVSGLDEFRTIISDPEIVSGLQSIASVMVDIVGLAVQAAAGWGLIFDAIGKAVEGDSPIETLREQIEATKRTLVKTEDETYKNALEQSLEQYQAQLDALVAADNARKEAEAQTSGGGGLGDSGGEAAEAAAQAAGEKIALVSAAELEAQLLADALVLENLQFQEEEKLRIETENNELRIQGRADMAEQVGAIEETAYKQGIALLNKFAGENKAIAAVLTAIQTAKAVKDIQIQAAAASSQVFAYGQIEAAAHRALFDEAGAQAALLRASATVASIEATAAVATGLAIASGVADIAGVGDTSSTTTVSETSGVAPAQPTVDTTTPEAPVRREIIVDVQGEGANTDTMRQFISDLEETAADMGSDTRLVLA